MRRVLVVLGAAGLALVLFLWRGCGSAPVYDVADDVAECCSNLRKVYAALVLYQVREHHVPPGSGVRFLAALVAEGEPAAPAWLTCPGRGAEPVRADVDYRALDALTGADSAYAARDMEAFPLAEFPTGGSELEPIAACDNARGPNHAGCMNVLYSDGSVRTLTLAQEIERGHLPAGATTIPVGADSPLPELRKLRGD